MAGLESMIVEEKQPPAKQVDREKVKLQPIYARFQNIDFSEEKNKQTNR